MVAPFCDNNYYSFFLEKTHRQENINEDNDSQHDDIQNSNLERLNFLAGHNDNPNLNENGGISKSVDPIGRPASCHSGEHIHSQDCVATVNANNCQVASKKIVYFILATFKFVM